MNSRNKKEVKSRGRGVVKVLTGNKALAEAARLCRPHVIAGYPITPQSTVVEYLSQYVANGELDAEFVEVEGEHSAMSVLMGASIAGGRTFTATSGNGLVFMYEPYCSAAGSRMPIVMAICCREMLAPNTVSLSEQDAMVVRDGGWIQIFVENNQEIIDALITAYRLAEDSQIFVPVNICYDGYYLSYSSDTVLLPFQEDVDEFLSGVNKPRDIRLDVGVPIAFSATNVDTLTFSELRYRHCAALEKAKAKLDQLDEEFESVFGRRYGGQIEQYRTEDADFVIVTIGSCSGTARVAIDMKREEGLKVGLVKIRMLRPFPIERVNCALQGKRAVGIFDRDVCFGWNSGTLYYETKAALYDLEARIPLVNFIDGLGGGDITLDHFLRAIEITNRVRQRRESKKVFWLALE